MGKYKFWNKSDKLYTPSGAVFTAEEYLAMNAWAGIDGVKCIIANAPINCAVFFEFGAYRDLCVKQGMVIPEGATDNEVLELISEWEDRVVEPESTAEERIAAALEYQNLVSMDDIV